MNTQNKLRPLLPLSMLLDNIMYTARDVDSSSPIHRTDSSMSRTQSLLIKPAEDVIRFIRAPFLALLQNLYFNAKDAKACKSISMCEIAGRICPWSSHETAAALNSKGNSKTSLNSTLLGCFTEELKDATQTVQLELEECANKRHRITSEVCSCVCMPPRVCTLVSLVFLHTH